MASKSRPKVPMATPWSMAGLVGCRWKSLPARLTKSGSWLWLAVRFAHVGAPPSLAMWLGGGMLYLWIIALIFYRYTFFTLAPSDLAPPYWINMGAAAISTLAGTLLIAAGKDSPVIVEILPFVRGLTLMWWATATWWIPMLLVLGAWRHVYRKFPLRYDPLYWGAVFPLGMYTAATFRLSRAVEAPYLVEIPRWFVWVALTAWGAAFVGMVVHTATAAGKARDKARDATKDR